MTSFIRIIGQLPSKKRIALECVRVAIRELLPKQQRDGTGVTPALVAQIIIRAGAMLREHDLNDDETEAEEQEKLLALACRYLMRGYDRAKAGGDVWWQDEDLEQADAILRGCLSNDRIDQLVAEARKHHVAIAPKGLRAALAISWVAAIKDILTVGKVRVVAVEGALVWAGLPSRRSLVAIILRTLRDELHVIKCTNASYGPGFARRYDIDGRSVGLPFVIAARGDRRRQAETAFMARMVEQNTYAHGAMLERVQSLLKLPLRDSQECLDSTTLPVVWFGGRLGVDEVLWASVAAIADDYCSN